MKKQFVMMFFFVALSSGFLSAGVTVGLGWNGHARNRLPPGTFLFRVDFPVQRHFFALRIVSFGEIIGIHATSEISGLYELPLTRRDSLWIVTVASGISMGGSNRGPLLGIPLEVQLFAKSQGAQLGVVLLASIYKYDTYLGFAIALRFGQSS